MSSQRTVKIGIIGAGGIANTHARYYRQHPWIDLAGVADIVPGKAAAFASTWGIPENRVFEDYRQMLETVDLEAVSICTHNMAHREPTVDALTVGKHVLLEKPMAVELEDARAIMRTWEGSGKILMVGFQPDFSTQYQVAKQIVDSGALGQIYYAESVAFRRWGVPGGSFLKKSIAGAGTLVDIGCYSLHTTMSLMGDPRPVTVSAMTGNFLASRSRGEQKWGRFRWHAEDVEVEDFATAFVRFENGAVMVFKSCWAANADSIGRPFFLGTQGGMALNPHGVNPPVEVYFNHHIGDLNVTCAPQGLREVEDWPEKIRVFAEAVRNDLPSPIDPRGVFLTNVAMDGMLRSAECGHEVQVDSSY
ncbi:MAG TPA: Gfo/Idh/MocA family oxidoreductase [Chloroflexota bacterium]|nr:Gfo/Idh/MocA family oxidoreductase [Chloroflexota bacterium]